jgi:hypothetical protein
MLQINFSIKTNLKIYGPGSPDMNFRSVEHPIGVSRAGVGVECQDRERQGCRDRAYRDVLAASPGRQYPPWLPTTHKLSGTAVAGLVLVRVITRSKHSVPRLVPHKPPLQPSAG